MGRVRAFWLALMLALWAGVGVAQERYQVDVTFEWRTEASIAPHWSRLIGFAHSSRYKLFSDGDTATSGLGLVATNGRVTVLEAELAEGRRRGRVGEAIVLPGLPDGVGQFSFELKVSDKHTQVSFVTMLAPSPDWFSGASGVSLRDGDAWKDRVQVPLWVWDAGVDSGPEFEGPNVPTQPQQSVRLLTHPGFLTQSGLRPIGMAVFTRLK
ncbi:spondin domain-containing protein [uncultured Tateyamaria sp.]|uniref:spondin domain-containing protein n=2 Tax=uncultured Tateyamaria sp. TaxID=455651 RepID=UPI00261D7B1C|nr:spondin domain-containing protein [uncultured Tateyamaria sp.]